MQLDVRVPQEGWQRRHPLLEREEQRLQRSRLREGAGARPSAEAGPLHTAEVTSNASPSASGKRGIDHRIRSAARLIGVLPAGRADPFPSPRSFERFRAHRPVPCHAFAELLLAGGLAERASRPQRVGRARPMPCVLSQVARVLTARGSGGNHDLRHDYPRGTRPGGSQATPKSGRTCRRRAEKSRDTRPASKSRWPTTLTAPPSSSPPRGPSSPIPSGRRS